MSRWKGELMSRCWFVVLSMTLALSPLSPVLAQEAPLPKLDALTEAQQSDLASLIELAENSVKRGDHQKALGYYADAYKLFPHPQLNHKLAECYERLGQRRDAIENYKRFIALMPAAPEVPLAKRKILELRDKEQRDETSLRIKSEPPGAVVYLNDEANGAVGTTPTIDLPVAPGTYTVILSLDGFERSEITVEVPAGQAISEMVRLKKVPKVEGPGPGKARPRKDSTVPLVLTIVGGVATASAVGFGIAFSASQDPDTRNEYTEEDAEFYELGMWMSAGVAVVSFAGALVLWMTDESPTRASLKAPPTPGVAGWGGFVTPDGGAGVGVFGRF